MRYTSAGFAMMSRRNSRATLERRLRDALKRVLKYAEHKDEFPAAYQRALDELVKVRLTLKDLERYASARRAA